MRIYIILNALSQGDHFFFPALKTFITPFWSGAQYDIGIIFPGLLTFITGSSYMPFSTKYPELIIPDQRVCLPRISCQARIRGLTRNNL